MTIYPIEVVIYYDGIQLWISTDTKFECYVGTQVETPDGIKWLTVNVSGVKLTQFTNNRIDLLDLIQSGYAWYLSENLEDQDFQKQKGKIPEDYLPLPGLFYKDKK